MQANPLYSHIPIIQYCIYPLLVSGSSAGSAGLQPGDVVEVCEGDLTNLQGTVLSVDGETVTMMPKHEDLHVSRHFNY